MRCETIQEAWSARMDSEQSPLTDEQLDRHLAACPACARFAASSTLLHRRLRVRPADPVPDLTERIVAAATPVLPRSQRGRTTHPQPTQARAGWARPALLVTALTQLALAVPALFMGDDHGAGIHVAHEQGSWDVALAVALLFVVWRPVRAVGLLPFVSALAVVLAATAVLDVSNGQAPAIGELHHLLDIAGIVLLWLLTPSRPGARRRHRRRRRLVPGTRPVAW
jgi:predicted anti-sigma-YlaC factor YlaD